MCGIVAILNKDPARPVDRSLLEAMTDELSHRGPDDRGVEVHGHIGLGHRRLSVIDLEGGHQPMSSPSGRSWIAYNGEVYNYRELRQQLTAGGQQLATRSDTEVLVALYERDGPAFAERLNGMFAYAILDTRARRLVIGRDRVGIKPLFVWDGPRCVVVASEIKAILAHPDAPRRLRPGVMAEYLQYRQLGPDRTMFDGIDVVPPATAGWWTHADARTFTYWSLPGVGDDARRIEEERLSELIADAVRMQLVSDVPLGAFNGGGVDSSLVTAVARRAHEGPFNTFAVGFADQVFDERSHARQVASHLGVECHELVMEPARFASEIEPSIRHLDEPLNHANSVPIRLLAGFAKPRVTVVLTGEGADELFGGYPRYRLLRVVAALKAAGAWTPHVLARVFGRLPGRKARLIATTLGCTAARTLATNARYVLDEEIAALTDEDPLARRLAAAERCDDPLRDVMAFELQYYLHNVLARMDRMTMAAGLEARVPLLDHRIVELAAGVPLQSKMPWGRTKEPIKAVARRWLPAAIVGRRKSGFGVPLDDWFRDPGGLEPYAAMLREPRSLQRGWWRPERVRRLVDEQRQGRDHGEILWSLVNCELWARLLLDAGRVPQLGQAEQRA